MRALDRVHRGVILPAINRRGDKIRQRPVAQCATSSACGYDTAPMSQSQICRGVVGMAAVSSAVAALAAGVAAVATLGAQSSADKWWPGYGSGADNSRYFASRQINKANVSRLQVAWTYPFGDTGSSPIVVRGVIYGRGRNGSLVAVDATDRQGALGPRKHERHDQPRHELLGERRRPRPAPDLRDEQPAAGARREDRQVDHVVRHQRRRRSARRHRRPRSGDASATSSRTRPARSSRT